MCSCICTCKTVTRKGFITISDGFYLNLFQLISSAPPSFSVQVDKIYKWMDPSHVAQSKAHCLTGPQPKAREGEIGRRDITKSKKGSW